jgi:addiction module RelE/StbE family toxin
LQRDLSIEWRSRALDDIASAQNYLSDRNPEAARRILERILQRSRELEDFPEMGKPGRLQGTRELLVPGSPYVLIYRIGCDAIDILRVLHTKRDWPPRRRKPADED